jgi:rubrerythrin
MMNSMNINKIFSVAMEREAEAREFYTVVAKGAAVPEVRKVFEQLAEEELGHYELLAKLQNDPSMPMKIVPPQQDYKVAESVALPKLSAAMKPVDAIAVAMKKEQQAVEFYRGLSSGTTDKQIKDMFENLANMELNHKHRLENVYVEIGYPESF